MNEKTHDKKPSDTLAANKSMILSATSENKPVGLRRIRLKELLQHISQEEILAEIGKSITLILSDLGLKQMPDSSTQKRIVYYLLKYYRDFSISEIQTAFELALIGRLGAEVKYYQSFDISALTRTLNAYRSYRSQNQTKALGPNESINDVGNENPPNKPSDFFKGLEKTYLNYLKTGRLEIYLHWLVYNRLLDFDILSVSENDWNQYFAKALHLYKKRLQNPVSPSQKEKYKGILQDFENKTLRYPFELSRIRNITKELIVKDFFQSLKDKQIDFHQLLQKSGVYEK